MALDQRPVRRGKGRPPGTRNGDCYICLSEHRTAIDERLALGRPYTQIVEEAGLAGVQIAATGLNKHVAHGGVKRDLTTIDPKELNHSGPLPTDLAIVIRDKVLESAHAGTLALDANHGLKAQELIDKRVQHQASRDLTLTLARLLSGGGHGAPATLIEGTFIDVTPEESPLLAPPEMRVID